MKVLVVLCAVVACCLAKPGGFAYSAVAPLHNVVVSSVVAAPAVAYAASPVVKTVVAAPAVAYAAPAVAAPAVAYAAPAIKAVAPIVAAPVPVVAAAPAVAYAAPAVKAVAPIVAPAPVVAAAPVVASVKTQYHAQDELGQASYGHSEPGQVHNAVQDAHGNKVGSFSYVNPDGHVLRTDYVADGHGYRVASNGVPVATYGGHYRRRRSLLVQTPASTHPLATAVVAPVAYAAPVVAPAAAHLAYAPPVAKVVAPVSYAAAVHAPVVYSVPAVRPAVLSTVVNNPGHAVSYRIH